MLKLRVIWPGKTKKSYYKMAIEDYADRIRKLVSFDLIQTGEVAASDKQRSERIRSESKKMSQKRTASALVLLDQQGKTFTSEDLARWLEKTDTSIDFIVGGPAGFELQGGALRLSLGPMTLPHELARVVLLEQIYRALTIIKRIPYHK